MTEDAYLQHEAEIVKRYQDSPDIFTMQLRFTDPSIHEKYSFQPGQFNMLYLYGVGEVAISIISDPEEPNVYSHTIRNVGRVTKGLAQLKEGDRIGVRGPFGRGWPVDGAKGNDVVVTTGGLGCAPVVAVINYITQRRDEYGKLKILQGVKYPHDFIFRDRYARWASFPNTEVIISADQPDHDWSWGAGFVTEHIKDLDINAENTVGITCGPEPMMAVAAKALVQRGVSEDQAYLSMERSMHCAVGHCGHCQFGGLFVCKDGPVFSYSKVKEMLGLQGF